jgi:protocatechuate 3,4-dioxygenase beta subunit
MRGWSVSRTALLACFALLKTQIVVGQSATFEGTVLNSATHAGVADVSVTLWTQRGISYKATTDGSGGFRFAGVQPGEYSLRFQKSGFEQLDQPGFGQPLFRVGMAGGLHSEVELTPFAILHGRVLDPEGRPAAHVTVTLGHHEPAESDAEGLFELDDLHPGSYTLRASPKVQAAASPERAERTEIIPTYYPSTASPAEAEPIQIRPGADLAGYDIHLRTSPVYHVRGVVLDETGKPVAKANVRLLGPGDNSLLAGRSILRSPAASVQYLLNIRGVQNQEATQQSREDGTFEFPSVRPGGWNIEAEFVPQLDDRRNLYIVSSGIVPAAVSDRDPDNVELRFGQGFAVEITADWGGRAPGNTVPSITLIPLTRRQVLTSGKAASGGGLTFEHLSPGRYRIVPTPGLPTGFYPWAVIVEGRDVLGQEVDLTPGMPPISVVYKPNPGSIRGTVGQAGGATVLVWPEGDIIPDMVRAVQADSRGAFEIPNVPPGDYSVIAFDRVGDQGGSESFVLGVVAGAPRVKVSEGSAEIVQVPLTRWPD